MAEDTTRGRCGGNVSHELDEIWVLGRCLRKRTLHTVDNWLQAYVTGNSIPALIVQFSHGGADLIVGICGNILHQKIEEAGVALKNGENL